MNKEEEAIIRFTEVSLDIQSHIKNNIPKLYINLLERELNRLLEQASEIIDKKDISLDFIKQNIGLISKSKEIILFLSEIEGFNQILENYKDLI
jgi:hypothetical protein